MTFDDQERLDQACARHVDAVAYAKRLYDSYCTLPMPRRDGMPTALALAWKIDHGLTAEQAAAHEYLYRWRLAIKAANQVIGASIRNPAVSIFGAPHTIGM